MAKIKLKNIHFLKLLRYLFIAFGIVFLICFVLAFTTLPYYAYHWLGTSKSELKWKPEEIIMLGGSGMPSESNLMRCWFTAQAFNGFPEAGVIIVMPGNISDSLGTPVKLKNELVLRGIETGSIRFENTGTNTRSQALECSKLVNTEKPVLLVTSPEHMCRAVLCFRKAGFKKVNALPAFENAAEADFSFTDDNLGGNTTLVPDVGNNTNLRYQVWNHLKYEILIAREWVALGYYKIRGWI